jgi:coenzyme F420-reducing hydrogenase alpha subunit
MESELLEDAKKIIEDANTGFEFVETMAHDVLEEGNIEKFRILVRNPGTKEEKEISITFDFGNCTANIEGLIEI